MPAEAQPGKEAQPVLPSPFRNDRNEAQQGRNPGIGLGRAGRRLPAVLFLLFAQRCSPKPKGLFSGGAWDSPFGFEWGQRTVNNSK